MTKNIKSKPEKEKVEKMPEFVTPEKNVKSDDSVSSNSDISNVVVRKLSLRLQKNTSYLKNL